MPWYKITFSYRSSKDKKLTQMHESAYAQNGKTAISLAKRGKLHPSHYSNFKAKLIKSKNRGSN
jgi:hypothetical protein